jgi:chromosome partitioning protein
MIKNPTKPRIFVFASQKGGSGKTTLSGHVAVQAHLAGQGPVGVIDTDPQRSLAQWHDERTDDSLMLRVGTVESVEDDVGALHARGARTIVIDTPPAATAAIGGVVGHADLVCIPARPSPHDLRAVAATIEIVETQCKPMVFILNGATVRARLNAEAVMSLSQHGTVAPVIVHNRMDFVTSMADGRSAMEVAQGSRAALEIETLWSYLSERLRKLDGMREAASEAPGALDGLASVVPLLDFRRRDKTLNAQEFFRQSRRLDGLRWHRPSVPPSASMLAETMAFPAAAMFRRAS